MGEDMSLRDKLGTISDDGVAAGGPEPAETVIASPEAVYIYAGRLEDGTAVVRDAAGVLHALIAVKKTCDAG